MIMDKKENVVRELLILAKNEVESEKLLRIPYESYQDLVNHILNNLESFSEDKIKLIRNAIATLIQRRINKLMKLYCEFQEIPEDSLLAEEKRLIHSIIEISLDKCKKSKVSKEEKEITYVIVSFKEYFPVIYITSNLTLGPFSKFDLITLTKDEVEDLAKKGIVEIIEVKD